MLKVFNAIKIHFLKTSIFILASIFLFSSCEEQIDDLWDNNDDTQSFSPVIGDWYADSIKSSISLPVITMLLNSGSLYSLFWSSTFLVISLNLHC